MCSLSGGRHVFGARLSMSPSPDDSGSVGNGSGSDLDLLPWIRVSAGQITSDS